jgi:hypothetical protein
MAARERSKLVWLCVIPPLDVLNELAGSSFPVRSISSFREKETSRTAARAGDSTIAEWLQRIMGNKMKAVEIHGAGNTDRLNVD